MKIKLLHVLAILLAVGWMVLIFTLSAQSAEESGGLSALISTPVTNAIASWQGIEDTAALYQQVDGVVRTTAHFSEYAVLGALVLLACRSIGIRWRWLPLLIGGLYAVVDEWHQSFSPGRVSDPADVLIDACGVFFGSMLTYLIIKVRRKNHVHHR